MGIDLQLVMPPPNQCFYTVPLDIAVKASRMVNDGLGGIRRAQARPLCRARHRPAMHGEEAANELERCMKRSA